MLYSCLRPSKAAASRKISAFSYILLYYYVDVFSDFTLSAQEGTGDLTKGRILPNEGLSSQNQNREISLPLKCPPLSQIPPLPLESEIWFSTHFATIFPKMVIFSSFSSLHLSNIYCFIQGPYIYLRPKSEFQNSPPPYVRELNNRIPQVIINVWIPSNRIKSIGPTLGGSKKEKGV